MGGLKKVVRDFLKFRFFWQKMVVGSHNLGHFLKICGLNWPYLVKKSKFQKITHQFF